mgnify:CR=1 FL=1
MKRVSNPNFWNNKYLEGNTAWDLGSATPILVDYLQKHQQIGKVCVLGCGNGYDALEFSKYNNEVYAVDFAFEALKRLKTKSKDANLNINLIHEDIFNLQKSYPHFFDFVFEYTCFCAIDPRRRREYFNVVRSILKPEGILFSIFIPLDKELNQDGPPFGVNLNEIESLVYDKFEIIDCRFSDLSVKPRKNREKIMILRSI